MKAMVLHQTSDVSCNPLQLQDQPTPNPKPGEILAKIHVCGVCRTDLHVVEGELPDTALPVVPGHQAVGTVVRLGAGVSEVKEGDRVGIAWLQGTCGQCEFCTSERKIFVWQQDSPAIRSTEVMRNMPSCQHDLLISFRQSFLMRKPLRYYVRALSVIERYDSAASSLVNGLDSMDSGPQPTSPSKLRVTGVARSM